MDQFFSRFVRQILEYLLIAALTVTPLLVAVRFRWAQLALPLAVAASSALIIWSGPDRAKAFQRLLALLRSPPALLVLAGFAWVAATIAWAPDRAFSMSIAGRGACLFAAAALVCATATVVEPARLFRPLLWTWTIAAVAAIFTNLTGGLIHRQFGCCAGGMQADMTGSAIMITLFVWPCAAWLVASGRRRAALLAVALALLVVAISKSGASGLAILAGLATVLTGWRRPRLAIVTPLAILVAGFVTIIFLGNLHWVMTPLAVLDGVTDFHSTERLQIWAAYSEMFWQRPWTGFGPGSERFLNSAALAEILVSRPAPDIVQIHPHSLALQILVETGLVGAILVILAAAGATAAALRSRPLPSPFAVAPVSAYLAAAMVNFGLWEWWWLTLMLLTMIFTACLFRADQPRAHPA